MKNDTTNIAEQYVAKALVKDSLSKHARTIPGTVGPCFTKDSYKAFLTELGLEDEE